MSAGWGIGVLGVGVAWSWCLRHGFGVGGFFLQGREFSWDCCLEDTLLRWKRGAALVVEYTMPFDSVRYLHSLIDWFGWWHSELQHYVIIPYTTSSSK